MSTSAYHRIGELLVAEGRLTSAQLEEALAWRSKRKRRFGEALTALGFVLESDVVGALAKQFDHPLANLEQVIGDPAALSLVNVDFARRSLCVPMRTDEISLTVAMADPLDINTIDALTNLTKMRIEIELATPTAIRAAIKRLYSGSKRKGTSRRKAKLQKDRDQLLELLANVEPWTPGDGAVTLKEAS